MLKSGLLEAAKKRLFPKSSRPKALGVLLCYNDADILKDSIQHLLDNEHDVIAWDHGSDDETSNVLDSFGSSLIERKFIPREFDFYQLYQTMSEHLIQNYTNRYDWISWPDQDEILEGPNRSKRYYDFVCDVFDSECNWIQFNNINFWFTANDDESLKSPVQRVRHYSIFPDCAPRIRAWRAKVTNIRHFNHNELEGNKFSSTFNLRHYPMRSEKQMARRLTKDRANLQRGTANFHYNNLIKRGNGLLLERDLLHYDDGVSDLKLEVKFNWREIYGYGPEGT